MSYRVGDTITLAFLESWATAGLANGDFTKTLYLNGSSSAQTVTISEIGSGKYSASFTANAAGTWDLFVHATSDTSGAYVHIQIEVEVVANDLDSSEVEAAATAALVAYDPPTNAELSAAQTSIEAAITALNNISTSDILGTVIESNGSITLQQVLQVLLAVCAGETDGDCLIFKTPDGAVTRVTVTVADSDRSSVTLNFS